MKMLNFNDLSDSHLFKMGCLEYDKENNQVVTTINNPVAGFDVSRVTLEHIEREINNRTTIRELPRIFPTLFRLLNQGVPEQFHDMLINQWIETSNLERNVDELSYCSLLLIQAPGTTIGNTKYNMLGKQSLIYCYRYDESKLVNDRNSGLIEVDYPDNDKIVFTLHDDIFNTSYSNEWRFYWVYDYINKMIIPESATTGFYKLTWGNNEF